MKNVPNLSAITFDDDGSLKNCAPRKYKSQCESMVTLRICNNAAVDPRSNHASKKGVEVYCDSKGNIYNAFLSITDIQTGKNSYYKLQILDLSGS